MFSWKKHALFEVVSERMGHSSIDGIFETEREAVERATYLLSLAKFSRVQVIQTGKHTQKIIFERTSQAGGAEVVGITAIEDASSCATVLEVFGHPSRMTLLRLTRRHADREIAIPCQTLHNYLALRMIEREGMLLNSGITRLAKIQAKDVAPLVAERERELGALWLALKDLARKSDDLTVHGKLLVRDGLGSFHARVKEACDPAEHDRVVSHAFGQLLDGQRDWAAKTRALIAVLEEDDSAVEGITWVDQVLSETIDGRDPIKALIGYAPDLGAALASLLATLNGKLDDRHPFTPALMDLSNALARWHLPEVEAALLRRVAAGLNGAHPLTRDGALGDVSALRRIVAGLACFSGFRGGPEISLALVRRSKTAMRFGETDLPFEAAVQQLCGALKGPGAQIGFLLDLAETDLGRQKGVFLFASLSRIFNHLKSARDLAPAHVPPDDVRRELGGRLRRAGIPRDLADKLMHKIATLPADATKTLAAPR
ncbi:hypothetical protein N825_31370 [Skermanella stibiiresistens SB22]|uniref:Uncharacterized protein n=1 Tax=Skermanella stibiiresistens SB22 TaxID=1385369 RepID=W9H8W3_9PROT|nr:hypothetical protein [Skermanella stibiiresistens]EWY41161.1 hypothetical protein N825_31370 [Skermanella stibiiresistens SB22]